MNLPIFSLLSYSITIILALLILMAVLLKNNQKRINLLFGVFISALIAWIAGNLLTDYVNSSRLSLIFARFSLIGPFLVSAALVNISLIFPRQLINTNWKHQLSIWLPFFLQLPLFFTKLYVSDINIQEWGTEFTPGVLYSLYGFIIIIYFASAFINFFRQLKRSEPKQRQQILLIMSGAAMMLITSIIVSVILPLFGNSRYAILAPSSTLFLSGALAYAIIKHKFLDINLLIFRTVSFTLLILSVMIIYALGLFTFLNLIPQEHFILTSTILALLLSLTFNPLKTLIEKITKDIFYKESYSSEKLLETIGTILRSTLSINTLTSQILRELTSTMNITKAAFYLKSDTNRYTVRSVGYPSTPSLSPNTIHNLTKAVRDDLLVFDDLDESATKMLMRQSQVSVAIPLRVKSTHHGLLVLEEKSSGEIYAPKDVEVLSLLAPQISIAIQNALSYDEIKNFAATLKAEVHKATKELRAANRRLKHLDKLKNEFIFIATHELKNPVTAMRGYLSMINENFFGKIPPKFQDPIKQLTNSNQQLVELVNDLLQIARSEAKTLTIQTENVDLCSSIDAVCGNLRPIAEQKGLKLVHDCPSDRPMVYADAIRLKEITNNLISNSIKYSEKGVIHISHYQENGFIITAVRDDGVGISPEDQAKLFTRFFRAEIQVSKGIPGTGLGLYIIKQIIEKMGGKIWLESALGKGSTFYFSLPQAR